MSMPTAQDVIKRTSYPYLWVSRSFGVPYGLVLELADAVKDRRRLSDHAIDGDLFFNLQAALTPVSVNAFINLIADLNRAIAGGAYSS